eukprot:3383762-Amphidinium_carterae.1
MSRCADWLQKRSQTSVQQLGDDATQAVEAERKEPDGRCRKSDVLVALSWPPAANPILHPAEADLPAVYAGSYDGSGAL